MGLPRQLSLNLRKGVRGQQGAAGHVFPALPSHPPPNQHGLARLGDPSPTQPQHQPRESANCAPARPQRDYVPGRRGAPGSRMGENRGLAVHQRRPPDPEPQSQSHSDSRLLHPRTPQEVLPQIPMLATLPVTPRALRVGSWPDVVWGKDPRPCSLPPHLGTHILDG